MKKLIILAFTFILVSSIHAQATEGDALIDIIGTKVDAAATQKFFTEYEIKGLSGGKYSSEKYGIDVTTHNDSVTSMTIYKNDLLYGSYTNKLPKGITFGKSSDEIIKLLGKPTTEYINTGYSEYTYGKRIMACWFENKALTSVLITLK